VNSNGSAGFEKRQPILVGCARTRAGLIAVQHEQVDRRGPSRRELVGAILMHFHPVGETNSRNVLLEALPKGPSPNGR
jgi:hypothetical protein